MAFLQVCMRMTLADMLRFLGLRSPAVRYIWM